MMGRFDQPPACRHVAIHENLELQRSLEVFVLQAPGFASLQDLPPSGGLGRGGDKTGTPTGIAQTARVSMSHPLSKIRIRLCVAKLAVGSKSRSWKWERGEKGVGL